MIYHVTPYISIHAKTCGLSGAWHRGVLLRIALVPQAPKSRKIVGHWPMPEVGSVSIPGRNLLYEVELSGVTWCCIEGSVRHSKVLPNWLAPSGATHLTSMVKCETCVCKSTRTSRSWGANDRRPAHAHTNRTDPARPLAGELLEDIARRQEKDPRDGTIGDAWACGACMSYARLLICDTRRCLGDERETSVREERSRE